MARLVVNDNVTLDGVMQGPSHADEDRRGGFDLGGWATPYADTVMAEVAGEGIAKGGSMLFGRRTYEDLAAFWPSQPDDNPFAKVLNHRQKYVVSSTLEEPLSWEHSTLLKGDAGDAVAKLKAEQDKDIVILGSGQLVRALMKRNLVDQVTLLIHPLVLGKGMRLFDASAYAALKLIDCKTTTTGVLIATYEPTGAPPPKA